MALTQAQIAEEQRKEAAFDKLSVQIIGMTAWGKFYPLMRAAAAMGEGAIPHKVCLDSSGRNLTVYNSNTGKIIGKFLKPMHEYAAADFSQGNYVWGVLDLLGWGMIHQMVEQNNAICVSVIPNDVLNRANTLSDFTASPKNIDGTWMWGPWMVHIDGTKVIINDFPVKKSGSIDTKQDVALDIVFLPTTNQYENKFSITNFDKLNVAPKLNTGTVRSDGKSITFQALTGSTYNGVPQTTEVEWIKIRNKTPVALRNMGTAVDLPVADLHVPPVCGAGQHWDMVQNSCMADVVTNTTVDTNVKKSFGQWAKSTTGVVTLSLATILIIALAVEIKNYSKK